MSISCAQEPDFSVQQIARTPSNPKVGSTVTFSVTFSNIGTGIASESYIEVTLWLDSSQNIGIKRIPPPPPGGTEIQTWDWVVDTSVSPGSHKITAEVDSNDAVRESSETNNEISQSFQVSALPTTNPTTIPTTSIQEPDFTIGGIVCTPIPYIGEEIICTATITNVGYGESSAASIETTLWFDSIKIGTKQIPPPPAKKSSAFYPTEKATWTWSIDDTILPGFHKLTAKVDPDNNIAESSENNNQVIMDIKLFVPPTSTTPTPTLKIRPPDFIIRDITWVPTYPKLGDIVIITVEVMNQGMGISSSNTIDVNFCIDMTCMNKNIPAPDVGEISRFSYDWTVDSSTTQQYYTIKATVNPAFSIPETKNYNNGFSTSISLILPTTTVPLKPTVSQNIAPQKTTIPSTVRSQCYFTTPSITVDKSSISIPKGSEFDLTFTIKNTGCSPNDQSNSHLTLSVSDGIRVLDYNRWSNIDTIYNTGDKIWYRNSYQFPTKNQMLETKSTFPTNSQKQLTVKFQLNSGVSSQQWIWYRFTLVDFTSDEDWLNANYYRNPPSSSTEDQQGWPVKVISVSPVTVSGSTSTQQSYSQSVITPPPSLVMRPRLLFDGQPKLVDSVSCSGKTYHIIDCNNLLSYANGIEVFSNDGQLITDPILTRQVFKQSAWKSAAKQLSSTDIATLQEILSISQKIHDTVAPVKSATGTVIGAVNQLKAYCVDIFLVGRKCAWDAVTSSYPGISTLEANLRSLDDTLGKWEQASAQVNSNLPQTISGLNNLRGGADVDPSLQSSMQNSMSSFNNLKTQTDEISSKLTNVIDSFSTAERSIRSAGNTPFVGDYIIGFANSLGGLNNQIKSVRSSAQSFSTSLSTQASKLSNIITFANQREDELLNSWSIRSNAETKVYATIIGLIVILFTITVIGVYWIKKSNNNNSVEKENKELLKGKNIKKK